MCTNLDLKNTDLKSVSGVQYEGDPQTIARASSKHGNSHVTEENNGSGDETVIKKRKTRRGKPKRRNPNPYSKPTTWLQRKNNIKQAQLSFSRKYRSKLLSHGPAHAPYNSNQFLMEDHGNLQELDDKFNKSDGAGSSLNHPPRTRDSSFSVDSEGDFYSSPEDEEEFLTKEFDHAYEDLQSERLQSLSKEELIVEYLQLEGKVEVLTKKLKSRSTNIVVEEEEQTDTQQEINKLLEENEDLRRENEMLRRGIRSTTPLSSSVDSESDSSSSTCNSSSSSNESVVKEDVDMTPLIEQTETNGFSPHSSSPKAV